MDAPPRPRIVCVTPVKNEAWILDLFLRTAELWADDIVISDQMSDDGSDEIAERHPKVRLVRYNGPYHESDHRKALFAAARRLIPGPKVFVALDADEMLAATVLESPAWQAAIRSPAGTTICLPWMNLLPGAASGWDSGCRPFAFVDDGARFSDDRVLHASRGPMSEAGPQVTVPDVPVLHFQYVDWARMRSKHRWYQCFDRLQHPERSAIDIFRQYHHMYGVGRNAFTHTDASWFSGYQQRGIDLTASPTDRQYRWDREVLDLFDTHGARHFSREWIWDQDWTAVGRGAARPDPAWYRDPRTPGERLMHRWLITTQRVHRRLPVRAVDDWLRRRR
jgi:Glycosyl transferase family 2